MWPESSSVSAVNLAKNITTIEDISNFSYGVTFLWRALYVVMLKINPLTPTVAIRVQL